MEHNGHDFIDILKIDIEGTEFASLSAFFDFHESQPRPTSASESPMDFTSSGARYDFAGQPLPFGQLQIELHPRESEESALVSSAPLHNEETELGVQSQRNTPASPLSSPSARRWSVSDSDPSGPR